jgi:hypothetical protein
MSQVWDTLPGASGLWHSDNVSAISSSGITENGHVDDLIAPGDLGWALCSTDTKTHTGCTNYRGVASPIQVFGGTSQAAPLVAGAAALVIDAYAARHDGAKPTPALVKQILTSTATDQLDPAQRQGAGLLNALAAVRAASSIVDDHATPVAQGDGLLFGASQLDVTGKPGSAKDFDVPVTNVGAGEQVISAHGRALSTTLTDQSGSVLLNTTGAPTMVTRGGAPAVGVTHTFHVPAGADHLDASIAWSSPNGNPVTLVLLDPTGGFAGYSLPQTGTGPDYGHVDVHSPQQGTWTALIYGARTIMGFNGQVSYEFATSRYSRFGTVSPASLTLSPGQTGTFHVAVTTPAAPGDLAAALELDTDTHQRFSVPIVMRSLVDVAGSGVFSGVLTGGNGRGGAPAQQNTFRFDVPAGQRDVAVSVSLLGDVNQGTVGYLVSPDGQIVGQATNVESVDLNGNPTQFGRSLQVYRCSPASGSWSFVVVFANDVSGSATREPFAGRVRLDTVDVRADNVPNSPQTVLAAGKPVSITVHVRNTGVAPESFFVDARSDALLDAQLTPLASSAGVLLSPSASVSFVVPPRTTRLTGITSAAVPVSADLSANSGEPEVLAPPGPGDIAVAIVRAGAVSQGKWLLEADQVGPFSSASQATANFAVVARTRRFDGTVTSSTGDQWLATVLGQAPAFTPLPLDAGESGTITVTIKPVGQKGTVVSGALYVDDTTLSNNAGDELASVPYTYTVG